MTKDLKFENEFEEMLKKIDAYFNKVEISDKLKCAINDLKNVDGKYTINHLPESDIKNRIKYYGEVLIILKQYNYEDTASDTLINGLFQDLLINLGHEHCNLGQQYFECDDPDSAFENFSKSIEYLLQIDHKSNINFITEYNVYKILSTSYEKNGVIRRDTKSFQNALSYYEKITELINEQLDHMKMITSKQTIQYEEIETLKEQKRTIENLKERCRMMQASIALSCDIRTVQRMPIVNRENTIKKHKHATFCCLI